MKLVNNFVVDDADTIIRLANRVHEQHVLDEIPWPKAIDIACAALLATRIDAVTQALADFLENNA